MTYGSPVRRGCAEIIEDLMPVYDIHVALQTEKTVTQVSLPLSGEVLPFRVEDGVLQFTVPTLLCHTTVVIHYEDI